MTVQSPVDALEVSKEVLKKIKGANAKISIDPDAKPRARPVPYSVLEKLETELGCLESLDIIRPVQFAEWAVPVVAVF